MKRFMLICFMILCLLPVGGWAETYAFDLGHDSEGFVPGAALYLPDFTGSGSHWALLSVSDSQTVRVTLTPIALSGPGDAQNTAYTDEIRLEGLSAGDAYVHLELSRDGGPCWRCNLYVIVDSSLDVKIQTAEWMPACGNIAHTAVDYGASDHFTPADMDAAIAVILEAFSAPRTGDREEDVSAWAGHVLQAIRYTSDGRSRRAFEAYGVQYAYRDSQGRPYVDGICFETSFHTPMTDDGWTGFEAGRVYSGYRWVLLRTEDGAWEIAALGY